MKKIAKKYFTKKVLYDGAQKFRMDTNSLEELAGFENFIYSGNIADVEYVIRFCHSSHRSVEQIKAELDWLTFLKKQGSTVCGPIPSANQILVEEITAGDTQFYVSVFEKAKGSMIKITENMKDMNLFYSWGKGIGELHRLTSTYTPLTNIIPREDYMEMSRTLLSKFSTEDCEVKKQAKLLFDEIVSLPKLKQTYMLTHTDLHSGNFFFDGKKLWMFDFDDCAYNYIVHDLAMPVYYTAWYLENSKISFPTFSVNFFTHFLKGYLAENHISKDDLNNLPLFLKFRDVVLYVVLQEEWEGSQLTSERKSMISSIRNRIIGNKPIVELPYDMIYNTVIN
ncbi:MULTISPECIES: phosphotransferase enzyme family protein [Bacillaceae]|uniref:Phosphotransferase n=1 Tax=Evansella alkalicola TaxID=745819 RepID=A0ABS6JNU4_9BACI|nr:MULTISPECIES: phosphotransferase [Bacillaceae]MBU9719932.1 phosphotransferase [Bacillus alkalicola]